MTYFMAGLGLMVLGFGFFQFSNLFNLYNAATPSGTPVTYWILRILGYLSMGAGAVVLLASFAPSVH